MAIGAEEVDLHALGVLEDEDQERTSTTAPAMRLVQALAVRVRPAGWAGCSVFGSGGAASIAGSGAA